MNFREAAMAGETEKRRKSAAPSSYRAALGMLTLAGGLLGMAGLYFIPVPEANREPLLLALGLVLGWGSTVIGYEFGSSPSGRMAADAGVRPTRP